MTARRLCFIAFCEVVFGERAERVKGTFRNVCAVVGDCHLDAGHEILEEVNKQDFLYKYFKE